MLARTPGAAKKRRQRERRQGLVVFGIEMHEHDLIEALLYRPAMSTFEQTGHSADIAE